MKGRSWRERRSDVPRRTSSWQPKDGTGFLPYAIATPGIWQAVTLQATETVKVRIPQVVTILPLPDTSSAKVEMTSLTNAGEALVHGTLEADFEGFCTKNVDLKPGRSEVRLTPADFPQLTVTHPRLWWRNGYGKQELYHLKLSFAVGGPISDMKEVRFRMRNYLRAGVCWIWPGICDAWNIRRRKRTS